MPIDNKEIRELLEILDERYVTQAECNDRHIDVSNRFSNDDKRIEIISHDFAAIKKLVWTIAAAAITQVVVSLFGLIFR